MAKSILQSQKECFVCRRWYNVKTVRGFSAHFDPALAQQLKCYAQQRFEETYTSGVPAHTVWMLHTGKDYTHA